MTNNNVDSFEDILLFDDRSVQYILRDTSNDIIVIALKNTKDEIRSKCLNVMSRGLMPEIQKRISELGSVSQQDINDNQKKIISIMKKLYNDGRLSLQANQKPNDFSDLYFRTNYPLVFENIPCVRYISKKNKIRIFATIQKLVSKNYLVLEQGELVLEDDIHPFTSSFEKLDSEFVREIFELLITAPFNQYNNSGDLIDNGDSFLSTYLKTRVYALGGSKTTKLCHQIIATAGFYYRKRYKMHEFEQLLTAYLSESMRIQFYKSEYAYR